jgi:predicted Na+-dependent transporter
MNIKRIFGAILTILGIVGLIYAAVLFVNSGESNQNIKMLTTYGILGLVFFVSGINLVRTTKDEA